MQLATTPAPPQFALEVYRERDGAQQLARRFGEPPTGDAVVDAAYDNALASLRLLHDRLGWNGWDGAGSPVRIVANSSQYTHWSHETGTVHLSADGDGGDTPTARARDVVMHEIGHGVALTRNPRIEGNSALGQTLANTFAMALDTDDWKLGEDVYAPERVYDYSDPARSFPDAPSSAMARIGEAVGRDAMLRIFFEATPSFDPGEPLSATAARTVDAARRIGLPPSAVTAVEQAWAQSTAQ